MNLKKGNENNKKYLSMIIAIAAIAFVVYNVGIFFWFGIKGHNTVFWFSWATTLVGVFSVITSLVLLGPIRTFLRDWLFGFPIVRYGAMYCVMQYTASITFMKNETIIPGGVVYPVQVFLIGAYLILAITCFLTKDNIKETEELNFEKTIFIKQLRSDIAALGAYTENEALKAALQTLADEARYSDPVSSELLEEIERELSDTVKACRKALMEKKDEEADALCKRAMLILNERNIKCKTLKRKV